jgi:hypothetical protein
MDIAAAAIQGGGPGLADVSDMLWGGGERGGSGRGEHVRGQGGGAGAAAAAEQGGG